MHAIYARVSTEEQALSGYSLDDQLSSCRKRLLSMGIHDTQEYIDDGYSGEFIERPALDRLRADLNAGMIESVTFYDPDRMSRNLTVQLVLADEFEKSGANLYFVTGDYDASPEGRLFFNMKGAVSAYEKAKVRERTSNGRRTKARKGKIVLNTHPFGYDWDAENSMYLINEREAEIVRKIYDMCLYNGLGIRVIGLELAAQGIVGRKNRPLSLSTVTRILTKEMYCGQHHLYKQRVKKISQTKREIKNNPPELWIPIQIPAIVSREIWLAAQEQLQRNKKLAKRNTKRDYLLRGLLHCALCGRSMTAYARPAKRKNGQDKVYHYYSCITKESGAYVLTGNRCNCRRIPVDDLEDAVWQCLLNVATGQKSLDEYLVKHDTPDYSAEIEAMDKKQNQLRQKRTDITRWYRDNLIDGPTAEKELQVVQKELAATITALAGYQTSQEKIKKPALSPTDILNAKTFEEKRNLLLKFPYQIHAVRINDDFEFCFKEG